MKRFLPFLFACLLMLTLMPVASAAPNGVVTAAVYDYTQDRYQSAQEMPVVSLTLNGKTISGDMPGIIVGGRTLAPLRLLAESLDAEVEWVPTAAQVVVRRGSDTILLTLGSATAYVNGNPKTLPDGVPAAMVSYQGQGYTMVPLRFFSETLHCQVGWVQESYTATIDSPETEKPQPPVTSQPSPSPDPGNPLLSELDTPVNPEKYLIAIDPGHGGKWSGAYYEKTAEKDLNLAMALKLNEILEDLGYRTLMTRSTDVNIELSDRSKMANEAGADVFVSIHCNAAENAPNFQGLYVYHHPKKPEGKVLAQAIQTPTCQFTGAVDRKINSANFAVVRETTMPAVLVETGFMSCSEELYRLKDDAYQTKMAQGIAQGLIQYLNAHQKP